MEKQERRLNLYRLKGWKGYAREGWKKIAIKYDTIQWNGRDDKKSKAKEIIETPFKKTYKF